MAFSDFGIESLRNLIAVHRDETNSLVRLRQTRTHGAPASSSHLLRASPCGQQTAKPPRPRKSRDGGSIPGPACHRADSWRGSFHLSPGRFIAIVLFQPTEPPDRRIDDDDPLWRIVSLSSVTVCALLLAPAFCHASCASYRAHGEAL
jgi:hypothetical protein